MILNFVLGLMLLSFSACHPRLELSQPVFKEGYAYVRVSENEYRVVARTDKLLTVALAEIGCGPCFIDRIGEAYVVKTPEVK